MVDEDNTLLILLWMMRIIMMRSSWTRKDYTSCCYVAEEDVLVGMMNDK
jgi:hypothetical protein